jgi:hypothetical protein
MYEATSRKVQFNNFNGDRASAHVYAWIEYHAPRCEERKPTHGRLLFLLYRFLFLQFQSGLCQFHCDDDGYDSEMKTKATRRPPIVKLCDFGFACKIEDAVGKECI